ncbi:hypothetical protein Bca101_098639 [Brassica carinata]
MSHNIIHFRCEGGMYCLVLKHAVEEINLSMVEARICKKVGLDECSVKLKLSYIPLLVGSDEKFVICDDEGLCGYLLSLDKDNLCHSNDDEIGDKAITRYDGNNQVDKQYE